MPRIDDALSELIRRLRGSAFSLNRIAARAGVPVSCVWSLSRSRSIDEITNKAPLLRRVESALDELDRERSAGGGADDPEHPVPPHSRRQMAAIHE